MGVKKDELTLLANKYNCDKGSSKHNYTKIYNNYFRKLRNKKFNMIEIGFGVGSSVKMWLDYFKHATLYCIDIMEKLPDDKLLNNYVKSGRLKFFSADQSMLDPILTSILNKDFEIIIDDGSHVTEDQQYSLNKLFNWLKSNGLYIIEDLNCKRGHNLKFKYKTDRMVNILKEYIISKKFKSKILSKKESENLTNYIDTVDIYGDKIAFIRKR